MVQTQTVEEQLRKIGCNFRFWGRSEIRELAMVLLPGEDIKYCVNGMYEGGFAMLTATSQRLLLIDKKPFYLTLEDIRFDMIAEINFNHRLLDASLQIFTPNKSFRFTALNQVRLRQMYSFIQQTIMELRQQYLQLAQPEQRDQYVNYAQQVASATDTAAEKVQLPRHDETKSDLPVAKTAAANHWHVPSVTPGQIGVRGMRKVVPVVGAYTRAALMSKQTRYFGTR